MKMFKQETPDRTPVQKELERAKGLVEYHNESVQSARESLERHKELYYEANNRVAYWQHIVDLEKANGN